MASPGKVMDHQAVSMKSRSTESIPPQLGTLGGMPIPRNVRAASVKMGVAIPMVACTMMGAIRFGSRWRNRMRGVPAPRDWAACMNSRLRRDSASARTNRAKGGPSRDGESEDHVTEPLSAHGHDGHGEDQLREGEENVRDAHQQGIGLASEVAGAEPQGGAEQETAQDHRDPEGERNP